MHSTKASVFGSLAVFVTALLLTSPLGASAATKTLQPVPALGLDRWVSNTSPDSNFSYDPTLWVAGIDVTSFWMSYLRFNLSGMPMNATKVILSLVPMSTDLNPTPITWGMPNETWQSSKLTWNNRPSHLTLGQTVAPTLGYWYTVDITDIYNLWRSGSQYTNNGLSMTAAVAGYNANAFVSSANTSYPSYRPKLTITYTSQSNDNIPHLRWPLGTVNTARTPSGYKFGEPWTVPDTQCPDGTWKTHVGIDYKASAGTSVYAAEDGFMVIAHPPPPLTAATQRRARAFLGG